MVDFIRIPPDSTGKRLYTKQVTIDGTDVQAQRMQIACGVNAEEVLQIDNKGSAYTRFAEGQPSFDGFSRMKVEQSYLIGVYEHSNDSYDDLFNVVLENGGTSVYESDESSVVLTVTGDINSKCIRTTNRYHYYQQGNSVFVMLAVSCGDTGKAGNIRQWGYFDDENGIGVGRRSSVTGSPQDTITYQDDWNGDKLDGSGPSGLILNPTGMFLYWIDWAFPGTSTRFGVFDADNNRVVCHTLRSAGANPFPYSLTASLPVRFSNINTGVTGSTSELREVMAVVFCETRDPNYTFWRYGNFGCAGRSVTSESPVFSCRSKLLLPSGKPNRINSYPETLSVFASGGAVKIDLVFHDMTSGLLAGDTWAVDNGSTLEGDAAATSIDSTSADYWAMVSFYCGSGVSNIDLKPYFELNDEGILLEADNTTQQVMSFVVTKLNPSDTVTVSLDLTTRELW